MLYGLTIFGVVAVLFIIGSVGALIAETKNQSRLAGFLLGVLLGFIGLAVVALLPRRLPKAPPGRWALECPRCNAIQNLRDEAETLTCWQCASTKSRSTTYWPVKQVVWHLPNWLM